MRLPEIVLDDRRFQDIVSEARLRIAQACPEWTEHNVSDPGVTLIELFAWMTEMTIYRLNRVPDKLHVTLLELLGILLDPPSAATTDVRFRLSGPPREPLLIRGGATEVGTLRTANEPSVVFQVEDDFTVPVVSADAYVLVRRGKVTDIGVADGMGRPTGADQLPFSTPPAPGDALHLGFEESLDRMLLRVEVDASQARGAGVDPEDPPLRWEVSQGSSQWAEAEVLSDMTGGFNYGSGTIELQLPPTSAVASLGGHRLHWLRCRIDQHSRNGKEANYSQAPEIYAIGAAATGALLPARHAGRTANEIIGVSDGTPGQTFPLRDRPVLRLRAGETLEVQDPETGAWQTWSGRESFVASRAGDPHFMLDAVSGEVSLGPAIRQTEGGWIQYGMVPPKGAVLRMTAYRHGGGTAGNVAPNTLTVLRSPIAGVDTVSNPKVATGGVDAETLDSARTRAAMEIRSRYRAVTAEDFEFMCGEASPRVARAVCIPPADGGAIPVRILPRVIPADRHLEYAELVPTEGLLREVAEYLDERRMIGTTIQLLPVRFRGLSVVVDLQAETAADPARVEQDVAHALYTYLNPLIGGSPVGPSTGWPFGRSLNQGELFGVVHAVDGVEFVRILRMYETNVATGEQAPKPSGAHVVLEPDELLASGQHIVKASHRPR